MAQRCPLSPALSKVWGFQLLPPGVPTRRSVGCARQERQDRRAGPGTSAPEAAFDWTGLEEGGGEPGSATGLRGNQWQWWEAFDERFMQVRAGRKWPRAAHGKQAVPCFLACRTEGSVRVLATCRAHVQLWQCGASCVVRHAPC